MGQAGAPGVFLPRTPGRSSVRQASVSVEPKEAASRGRPLPFGRRPGAAVDAPPESQPQEHMTSQRTFAFGLSSMADPLSTLELLDVG
jgi:hypothetical protein